jgi:raffinose/stachyose/melibiose transport system substrate-binding protein
VAAAAFVLAGCAAQPEVPSIDGDLGTAKLSVWLTYGGCEVSPAYCALEDAFTALHPGITFENTNQPPSDYFTLIRTANLARTGPDLEYVVPGQNVLDNAEAFVALNEVIPADIQERLYGLAYSSKNYKVKDGVMAAPIGNQSYVTLYNTELFEQAGISTPPRTWDELYDACDKLKSIGVTPMEFGDLSLGTPQFYVAFDLGYMLAGVFTPEQVTGDLYSGQMPWNNDALVGQLEKWQELYTRGCTNGNVLTEAHPYDAFTSSKAAMLTTVTPADIPAEMTDKVSVMPLPYNETVDDQPFTFMSGGALAATSYGKNIDAAAAFLAFVASEPGQTIIARSAQPALAGIEVTSSPIDAKLAEMAQSGDYRIVPFIDNILQPSVYGAAQSVLPSVLAGEQTAEGALKAIDNAVAALPADQKQKR